jgi:hypothetical protein
MKRVSLYPPPFVQFSYKGNMIWGQHCEIHCEAGALGNLRKKFNAQRPRGHESQAHFLQHFD